MSDRMILVIDAGTSAIRCNLFDGGRGIVSSVSSPWTFIQELDVPELARAIDPGQVWLGISDAVRRCLQGRPVLAVAVTSQRQALAFLDDDGLELYVGPNIDLRAVFEGAVIDEEHGQAFYAATGHLPSFMMASGKLRWFQIHRPNVYAKISTVFSMADWLCWKLSGSISAERTLAAESGLLDLATRSWATRLYDDLGLPINPLRLLDSGDIAGEVSVHSAVQTGLPVGVPVIAAGADTQCGLLGLGVSCADQIGVIAGWSAPTQMVASYPVIAPSGATWTGLHIMADTWVLESGAGDMGNAYHWLNETLIGGGNEAYGEMDELATHVPLGSHGARAFLGPWRMDVTRLGMRQGGIQFPVPLTMGDFGRGHLTRAALEGFAFAIRANVEQLEKILGQRSESIAVGGGMIQSSAFVDILVDVLGRPIRRGTDHRSTTVGAALCAKLTLGEHCSLDDAMSSLHPSGEELEPDPVKGLEYTDLYAEWMDIGNHLSETLL